MLNQLLERFLFGGRGDSYVLVVPGDTGRGELASLGEVGVDSMYCVDKELRDRKRRILFGRDGLPTGCIAPLSWTRPLDVRREAIDVLRLC